MLAAFLVEPTRSRSRREIEGEVAQVDADEAALTKAALAVHARKRAKASWGRARKFVQEEYLETDSLAAALGFVAAKGGQRRRAAGELQAATARAVGCGCAVAVAVCLFCCLSAFFYSPEALHEGYVVRMSMR